MTWKYYIKAGRPLSQMVTLPHITHNGKSNAILAQTLASRRITHDAVRDRLSSDLPAIISIADIRQNDNGYTLPSTILLDPVESSITLSLRSKHMKKDTGFLSKLKRLSKQGCRRTTWLAHLAQMPAHQLHNPLFSSIWTHHRQYVWHINRLYKAYVPIRWKNPPEKSILGEDTWNE